AGWKRRCGEGCWIDRTSRQTSEGVSADDLDAGCRLRDKNDVRMRIYQQRIGTVSSRDGPSQEDLSIAGCSRATESDPIGERTIRRIPREDEGTSVYPRT